MAPISKLTTVVLAVVCASVLMTAVECTTCPYGLEGLKNTLASFDGRIKSNANQTALLTTKVNALDGRVTKLEGDVASLKSLVESFYNAATKAITATRYNLLPNGWYINMEPTALGPVFVIRQSSNPDYRYALYPNKYVDVN